MNKHFVRIASYAKAQDIAIKIFTNGTLINKPVAKTLNKLRPICVEVSLYSQDAEIHDKITRVKGSWQKTNNGIRHLRDHGIKVKIKCSLLKTNMAGFDDTLAFLKGTRIPFQCNPVVMPSTDKRKKTTRQQVSSKNLKYITERLSESIRGPLSRKEKLDSSICSAGITSLGITAGGDIIPCIALPVKLGNIMQDSIEHVWNTNSFLNKFRHTQNKDLKTCHQCNAIEFCSRCPGISYLKTGNYKRPYKEACTIAKTRQSLYTCQNERIHVR